MGGNLSAGSELSLAVTVLGAVERGRAAAPQRAPALGDRILVTGSLGGAGLELARAERGRGPHPQRPDRPACAAGRALARLPGVGACIDVSDGLEADLAHLLAGARTSCAEIDPGRLPLPRGFAFGCARLGLDPDRLARTGGEDYELLFTLRPGAPGAAALARRLGVRVSEIGRVVRGRPGRRPEAGWRHFQGDSPPGFKLPV